MTGDRWPRLAALVEEALELAPEARGPFLDRACLTDGVPDAALRAEAAALIAAAERAEAEGAFAHGATDAVLDALSPEHIGPWRITGVLGEGGMGVVYAAERADGRYQREVALKVLRHLGPAMARRFDRERRALARLEHPHIARLYDADIVEGGALGPTPYLAMERIAGAPLPEAADRLGLGVAERVRLILQVCAAVEYAHGRLVLHRDLKPSNVLVAETAEGPRAVVLDFGIAKLLGDAPEAEAATQPGHYAYTAAYAAPEQLAGHEVTAATDVYGLGGLLYEALADVRPYDPGTSSAAAYERIKSVPPRRASEVAPPDRARQVRGDLDVICRKALDPDPARRYASAAAFADDLRLHLDGLPVRARPATVGYRTRRFVRRHRVPVAAALTVALALVGGSAVALGQARQARAEAARAETVRQFLVGLFNAPNPEVDGRDVRVATLLDRAAAELDSVGGDPADEAVLRTTLGVTYRGLGLYDAARGQLDRALALQTRLHGAGSAEAADVQNSLARLLTERGDYAEADSLLALALATARRVHGDRSAEVSETLNNLGQSAYEQGDVAAAAGFWREAFAIDEATLGPGDRDLLTQMGNLGLALFDSGETDAGIALLERQLAALRRYHPADDNALANALANLGSLYADTGRYAEAATLQREGADRARRIHGDQHPDLAFALSNLGATLGSLGRAAESEAALRESAAIYVTAYGTGYEDHPDVGYPLHNLAWALVEQGRTAEAEAAARRAADVFEAAFGPGNARTARARLPLAAARLATDDARGAEALVRAALPDLDANLPDDHPDRAIARSLLGDALRRQGRTAEAAPLLRESARALRARLGADDPRAKAAAARLAALPA